MKKHDKLFSIFIVGLLLNSCSNSDDSNISWSKMSAAKKIDRLDAQMADRFNYLNNRINELEQKIHNLENDRR